MALILRFKSQAVWLLLMGFPALFKKALSLLVVPLSMPLANQLPSQTKVGRPS